MKLHNAYLHAQQKLVDLQLLLIVIALVIFGLIMVYDSSVIQALRDYKDGYFYIRQQLIWVGIGGVLAFFLANINYQKLKIMSVPLIAFSLILLIAVFIPGLGVSGGGAHRWLKLGFVTIQPAEIIKLTSVIYLATIFEKKARILPFIILVGLTGFVMAVLQKDLGSTIVFVLTSAIIFFISGGSLMYFLLAIPPAVISLLVLVLTSEYRRKRILAFLDPFSDTQGFTYHISQVLIALGSGGIFGLGLGQSRQKFEYIPEVSTDSIFGVIGEELGFLGGIVLISLFVLLIFRGIKIAQQIDDNFGKILALGLTAMLGIQAIVNLSSMVALLPLTGVPLPFISYGGSALVANLMAVGILLNISKNIKL
ncbi:putative lipid II flippase FtsW [Candidatus Daviesbacteria bacterium]|nr:putative lipid II flippase FtsW [Candidatus Daviesbacteria bacterium]